MWSKSSKLVDERNVGERCLSIVVVGLVLITCANSLGFAQKKVELDFQTLYHGGDSLVFAGIIDKFNKENPNVKINLAQGEWTEYIPKLVMTVAAGNPPHLGVSLTTYLPQIARALTPLEKSRAGNLLQIAGIKKEDYIEKMWGACVYEGTVYMVPIDDNSLGSWYNKDIFKATGLDPENPPSIREDFEIAANKIKVTGKYAVNPTNWAGARWVRRAWEILFWQQGGELFDRDFTRATFNNEKALRALQYLVNMFNEWGWIEPGTNGLQQFLAGELGMMWAGSWNYIAVERSGVNYGVHYIPRIFDKDVTWGASTGMLIPLQPSDTSDEELIASIKVIKWINENSEIWGAEGGHVPSYKPILNSDKLRQTRGWKKSLRIFADMSMKGIPHFPIRHPKATKLEHAIEAQIEEAVNAIISPKEALDRAEAKVNEILR